MQTKVFQKYADQSVVSLVFKTPKIRLFGTLSCLYFVETSLKNLAKNLSCDLYATLELEDSSEIEVLKYINSCNRVFLILY